MSRPDSDPHISRPMSRVTGAFLVVAGAGFLLLYVKLRTDGELVGDVGVSGFMLGFGSLLILVGSGFLRSRPERPGGHGGDPASRYLFKLRPIFELLAAIGGVFMIGHVLAMCLGVSWPSRTALWFLVMAPIAPGLLTLRILAPHAFQEGLFTDDVLVGWNAPTRVFVNILLRIGWAGYFGIALAWADLDGLVPRACAHPLRILACSTISVLYASQVLVLHFGRTRMHV